MRRLLWLGTLLAPGGCLSWYGPETPDIVTLSSPFAGIQNFFGHLAPFTLDVSCMSHWECQGDIEMGRDSCGSLEDPCIARIRGDIGDSIFNYWTPGYMKNELLDGHSCGSVYEIFYDGGTEPVYVVIADIQPGYVTIQDQADPTNSPWEHLKDSWMPDTWDKESEVFDYLEIEAAGWNALEGVAPWIEPCHEITEDDMSPPPNLPQVVFDAQLVAFSRNRRHNTNRLYQSKSFVRWMNYLRGLHGIPLMFQWSEMLTETQEEHVEAIASTVRTDLQAGMDERVTRVHDLDVDLLFGRLSEATAHSVCANCPRTLVKIFIEENQELLVQPWNYLGFWCSPFRTERHIESICSMMLTSENPDDVSDWGELVTIVRDGPPGNEFTTTTTPAPACGEVWYNGPNMLFVEDCRLWDANYVMNDWGNMWWQMFNEWGWWLEPQYRQGVIPNADIPKWNIRQFWRWQIDHFSDKHIIAGTYCSKLIGKLEIDDRRICHMKIQNRDARNMEHEKSSGLESLYLTSHIADDNQGHEHEILFIADLRFQFREYPSDVRDVYEDRFKMMPEMPGWTMEDVRSIDCQYYEYLQPSKVFRAWKTLPTMVGMAIGIFAWEDDNWSYFEDFVQQINDLGIPARLLPLHADPSYLGTSVKELTVWHACLNEGREEEFAAERELRRARHAELGELYVQPPDGMGTDAEIADRKVKFVEIEAKYGTVRTEYDLEMNLDVLEDFYWNGKPSEPLGPQ